MASHKYDIIDEHGTGTAVVQGLGTWTGPALDISRYPNLLIEADLTALTGTGPSVQLKIDSSADGGATWGNGDVYSGPSYTAAVAHWGFRGTSAAGKNRARVRIIVTGTTPSASFVLTCLGAANA